MPSINTNYGAAVALQSLNKTSAQLETTQNRINTGKAVNSAKDNGALWAVAQNQTNQMNALEPVKQSLQRGQSTIDVAMAADETVLSNIVALPPAEGESAVGALFIKRDCKLDDVANRRRILLRANFYRKPGQSGTNPQLSTQLTQGQFESSARLEILQLKP